MPSGFMYRHIVESDGKQNVMTIIYFIVHMPIFAVNLDHITTCEAISKYYAMLPFLTFQEQ
jgi:hypothetical protein